MKRLYRVIFHSGTKGYACATSAAQAARLVMFRKLGNWQEASFCVRASVWTFEVIK